MSDSITFGEAKTKVENELDLRAENFVTETELKDFFNQAIDYIEAQIHKLGMEDEYFLKQGNIAMVNGTADYDLPSDIYANKIKALVYAPSVSEIYMVKRVRGENRFLDIKFTELNASSDADYRYIAINQSSNSPQIRLVPAARVTSSDALTIWYIRNAAQVDADSDVIDIPEFFSYTIQFVKNQIKKKEGTFSELDLLDLKQEEKTVVDTLTNMIPDGDDTLIADFSHYNEFSYPDRGGRSGGNNGI